MFRSKLLGASFLLCCVMQARLLGADCGEPRDIIPKYASIRAGSGDICLDGYLPLDGSNAERYRASTTVTNNYFHDEDGFEKTWYIMTSVDDELELCDEWHDNENSVRDYDKNITVKSDLDNALDSWVNVTSSGSIRTDSFRSNEVVGEGCLENAFDWVVEDHNTSDWLPNEFPELGSPTEPDPEYVDISTDATETSHVTGYVESLTYGGNNGINGVWYGLTQDFTKWNYDGVRFHTVAETRFRADTFQAAIARKEKTNPPNNQPTKVTWGNAEWYMACQSRVDNCIMNSSWKRCTVTFPASCPGSYRLEIPVWKIAYNALPTDLPSRDVLKIPVKISEEDAMAGEFSVPMPMDRCMKMWPDTGPQPDTNQIKPIRIVPIPDSSEAGTAVCPGPGVESLHASWTMGQSANGLPAGFITLEAATLSAGSIGLGAFQIITHDTDDKLVVTTLDADTKLVEAAHADLLLTTLTGGGVQLEFFKKAGGSIDQLQVVTHKWKVRPSTPNDYSQVVIEHLIGGNNETYTFSVSGGVWGLNRNGEAYEQVTYEALQAGDPADMVKEVRRYRDSVSSADEYVDQKIYRVVPAGRFLVKETKGYGSSYPQVTEWVYDLGSGRLESTTRPDGSWERRTYYSDGQLQTVTTPWKNSLITDTASGSHKVVEYTYGNSCQIDDLAATYETQVTSELGEEVARTVTVTWSAPVTVALQNYGTYSTQQVWVIRAPLGWLPNATTTSSALLASTTLRITRNNYATYTGELIRAIGEDGQMTITVNSAVNGGGQLTINLTGKPTTNLNDVEKGERRKTYTNGSGEVVREETWSIETGLKVDSRYAYEFENGDRNFGRPLKFISQDNSVESREYACCGRLHSEVDRDGVETVFNYDASGRIKEETREGITRASEYDAAGHLTRRVRKLAGSADIVEYEAHYDLAGRKDWEKTATDILKGQQTSTTYSLSGGALVVTQTHSGSTASVVQTYFRDGRLASRTGSGVAPVAFDYGVSSVSTGSLWEPALATPMPFIKETKLSSSGAETSEWTIIHVNQFGEQVETLYPDSAAARSFYDKTARLVRQVDPDGVQMLYDYDDLSRLSVSAVDYNRNGVIDFAGTDRITRTTRGYVGSLAKTTVEVWQADGSDSPVEVSVTTRKLDGSQMTTVTNGDASVTESTFDFASKVRTSDTTSPDGTRTVLKSKAGRPVTATKYDMYGNAISEIAYSYDAYGRLKVISNLHTPGSVIPAAGDPKVTTYTYYDDDKVHTVTSPDPNTTKTGTGYDAPQITYEYDDAGRVSSVTKPGQSAETTLYWPNGAVRKKTGGLAYPVDYTYDAQGRKKTQTTWKDYASSAGGATTTWTYDPQRGWLSSKTYEGSVAGPTYTYWPSGRLKTRVWARGITTTYTYNNAGSLWTTVYDTASAPTVTTLYDRMGRPATITDAAGTLTRTYDRELPDDESYSGGLLAGQAITRSLQSGLARPGTLGATGINTLTYDYDDAGRLWTITESSGPVATFGYQALVGALQSITVTTIGTTRLASTRGFDQLGRVVTVDFDNPSPGLLASRTYTYSAANQRTLVEYDNQRSSSQPENTQRWAYRYDELGQVNLAEKRLSNDSVLPGYAFAFDYDDIGNRESATANGRMSTYTSDLLNRYVARGTPLWADVRGKALSQLDSNGVEQVKVLVNDELATRTGEDFYLAVPVNGLKENTLKIQAARPSPQQAVTENRTVLVPAVPEAFVYDADGNLTQDGLWNYEWDGENRLKAQELRAEVNASSWKRLEYAYDGQSRRIQKVVKTKTSAGGTWTTASDTRFLYDGWNLIAEYTYSAGTFTLLRSHVWGLDLSGSAQGAGGVDGLLWTTVAATAKTYAAGSDANGNVVLFVDCADGSIAGRRDYGAFGEPVLTTGVAGSLPFGFSTKFEEKETGLYYYGYRFYNPGTGRWLSRDPIGERGGENLYGMVADDLINKVDMLGQYMLRSPAEVYSFKVAKTDFYTDETPGYPGTYYYRLNVRFDLRLRMCNYKSQVEIRQELRERSIFTNPGGGTHNRIENGRGDGGFDDSSGHATGIWWDGTGWSSSGRGMKISGSNVTQLEPEWTDVLNRYGNGYSKAVFWDAPGQYNMGSSDHPFPFKVVVRFRTFVRDIVTGRDIAEVRWGFVMAYTAPSVGYTFFYGE